MMITDKPERCIGDLVTDPNVQPTRCAKCLLEACQRRSAGAARDRIGLHCRRPTSPPGELFGTARLVRRWPHRRFTAVRDPADGPGTVIGPYKLLQQIGEGGMGVVFMAEQDEPIRRTVALKIIKPGMDTRQVIARFEAERQAWR